MMDRSGDSFDWSEYDWAAVDNELEKKGASMTKGDELDSLPRDMFVEYIRYLHDEKPELYHIMLRMYEADRKGDIEELRSGRGYGIPMDKIEMLEFGVRKCWFLLVYVGSWEKGL